MAVAQAISGLDNAANQIQSSHAKVGASLAELDTLGSANSSQDVIYSKQLSTLQDVDYTKAISDLGAGQMSLQAAQQSYALISKLSLFDYL
jgi:flagellar hook-associated protein 3 FlgL